MTLTIQRNLKYQILLININNFFLFFFFFIIFSNNNMKYLTKDNIIKNMNLIISYETNQDKSKKYSSFLKNLIAYPYEVNYLKDLDNIKGLTKDIKDFMRELKKTNEISYIKDFINKVDNHQPFNKKIIIKNLEIIRDYEIYNNELLKVKAYNKVIANLHDSPFDINDLKDLKKIDGIGKTILSMISYLKKDGNIPYIENIIKKDEKYSKSLLAPKTANKNIKFDKQSIIKHLEIIRNYEIFNNNLDKGKAYINAILNIKHFDNEIKEMKDLKEIKGIGKAITLLINELKNTGKINYIDNIINKDKDFITTTSKNEKLFNKEDLIQKLETIKDYETYNNEIYKVKAYTSAINNILIYQGQIKSITDLDNIEGIGAGILEKIYEYFLTGKISYIENNIINDKIYNFKQELLHIYGIGPINAKKIINEGIQNIEQLKKNKNILNDKQKIGLKYYDDLKLRIPLIEYNEHLKILKKDLNNLTFDFVGSYRRGNKTMGDIDLLIMENDKFNLKKYISKLIDNDYIIDVLASGKNKFMGIVKLNGKPARRLDILVAPVNEYYYSLLYFTGSNLFNIGLRHYVKTMFNLSLSEHGFNKSVPIKSEEDIFKYLKLKYVKPIDRNKFEI
jgi:DNA polymerase/3'-5' exonuclease PolX